MRFGTERRSDSISMLRSDADPSCGPHIRLGVHGQWPCRCYQSGNKLPPPHEHLPRKRTLLSTAVKHERARYAMVPHFSFRFLPRFGAADWEGRARRSARTQLLIRSPRRRWSGA
jgi:hypothetical protein